MINYLANPLTSCRCGVKKVGTRIVGGVETAVCFLSFICFHPFILTFILSILLSSFHPFVFLLIFSSFHAPTYIFFHYCFHPLFFFKFFLFFLPFYLYFYAFIYPFIPPTLHLSYDFFILSFPHVSFRFFCHYFIYLLFISSFILSSFQYPSRVYLHLFFFM